MANFFDQFDTPAAAPATKNFFDQFDPPSQPGAPVSIGAGSTAGAVAGDARALTVHHGGATGSWDGPSATEDVIKGIGSGLARGAVGTATGPIELTHMAAQQLSHLAGAGARYALGMPQLTDQQAAQRDARVAAIDAQGGGQFAPAQVSGAADRAVQGATYQPQTTSGQVASNVAGFVPASLAGGSGVVRNAIQYGIAPGLASEGLRRLGAALGPTYDAAGRIVGGVLGAGGVHALSAAPTDAILSGATRGVSNADIAAARGIQERARGIGIDLTSAEAIQQATDGRSNLGNLQRNIEAMSDTAPVMADYMANRPLQIRQAADRHFSQIGPLIDPYQAGVQAQREAEGAMSNIRQDRSNVTGRFYDASQGDQVPHDQMAAVAQQIDRLAAENPNNPALTAPLSNLRRQIVASPGTPGQPATAGQRIPVTDPRTGAIIRYDTTPGTPAVPPTPERYITNVGQLDKIYGGLRDQYTGPAPLGQSGTDARAGSIAGQGLGYLNDQLTAASPMPAAGRQAYGVMTDRWVAPREAGPIGQITATNDLQGQGRALYPINPSIGAEAQTAEAVQRQTGPNQWGGAKFAAQTYGNPQQAATLEAGIAALPNGDELARQNRILADALRGTGYRQQAGSKTSFNDEFRDAMQAGTPLGNMASLALAPNKALGAARDWYQQQRIGKNASALARASIEPRGIDLLEAARQRLPPDQYNNLLARALLARTTGTVPAAVESKR